MSRKKKNSVERRKEKQNKKENENFCHSLINEVEKSFLKEKRGARWKKNSNSF